MKYIVIHLLNLIDKIGETAVKAILSNYSCPLAPDVESFLKEKAIDFANKGWAQTNLIFTHSEDKYILVGYFALASKVITIPAKNLSKSTLKRIATLSTYDNDIDSYFLSAPLIAQLGKNYYAGYDKYISGSDLLNIACDKVVAIQFDLGGRYAYVECENIQALIKFYTEHNFFEFDRRYIISGETKDNTQCLVRLLRYFKQKKL